MHNKEYRFEKILKKISTNRQLQTSLNNKNNPWDEEDSDFYSYHTTIFKKVQSMQSHRKVWSIYRGKQNRTETIPEEAVIET